MPSNAAPLSISKGADGFGFVLGLNKKTQTHYFKIVDDNGPASVGGARKDDLIFEINAVSVTGLTHSDVVKLIKAGGSTVNFKIVRGQPVR